MKKLFGITLTAVLVLGLTMFSCKPPAQEETPTEATFGAARVKVYEVSRQTISANLYYTGLIEARNKIAINPEVGGKIARIYVEEGDRIRRGDLLAELDTRAIRLQLEQAEAGLAVADANHKDAELNFNRMERLKNEDAVSEQQYEKLKLAYEAAESQRLQAKAAVNLAKYNLDVSIMEAPFSGVIAAKNSEVGDIVNPMMGGLGAGSGILTLMDFSQVKIQIEVSQLDIVRIKKGQIAHITVSALPEKIFTGKVTVVNLAADPVTKKFPVEVRVNNPELMLRPNTYGEVTIEVNTRENTLVVPQKAVLENSFVFISDGNKAIKKPVKLGLQNIEWLEIIEGLKLGDLVVIEGNYGLEEGAALEIQEVIQ